MPANGAYDVDLAYVHDTGFGDFARNAAPSLLRTIAQCGSTSTLVVDLGCGSGIWARCLADAGHRVTGVDISAAMLAIARRRVPEGTFLLGSFVDFPVPACRAVTALGEVFSYRFDEHNSLSALRQVFRNVFDALVPGGVLIFDVVVPGRHAGLKQAFREGEDWACLVEYLHDEPNQQLTRRIVTFRRLGDAYRRHEETHRQQLYQSAEVAEALRSIGFLVEIVAGYGERTFPAGVAGFMAMKP
ncbi:MAG TPA: class I SAM-dependent methyltransferase [Pirellulales bacterium]